MHELSMIQSIIQTLEKSATEKNLARISKVKLVVGEFLAVSPASLRQAFAALSRGTPAEGAELEVEERPLVIRCMACGHHYHTLQSELCCPECGDSQLSIIQGRELYIDHYVAEDEK